MYVTKIHFHFHSIHFRISPISSQIFWPASTSKVEECQMAGKDPTVRTLTLPNTRKFMFGHFFHAFDTQ